ncbi:MAG: phage portal protein family [Clostridiaceae bacterium]|nr:phage portal protein family [Clostridiaceae bacterium]
MIDNNLLTQCKTDFDLKLHRYQKMRRYYDGYTDAMLNYKMVTKRSNNKINCNFIQKFINEEANYCCGNPVTYSSHTNDSNIIEDIRLNFKHWKTGHDKELCKQALIYNEAYELAYVDSNGLFNSLICTPQDSYILEDDFGNIELFIRFFYKKFDESRTLYADVYTDTDITHYTCTGSSFQLIKDSNVDANIFSKVPVSIVRVGSYYESLYKKIKDLQDAYSTNLSDITNEISDFRNAYLKIVGAELDDTTQDENGKTDLDKMKEQGVLNLPTKDSDISWIIKNINDSFIQNTLSTQEDKMYQLSSHINHNEKLASNTSSLALKNRLISLEQKCTDNIQALTDAIKLRLQFLFEYLKIKANKNYDWMDIDVKFTPNIPSDDLMVSQVISQLNGKLSIKTGLSQLSFVSNTDAEMKQIEEENKATSIGNSLLNNAGNQSGGING